MSDHVSSLVLPLPVGIFSPVVDCPLTEESIGIGTAGFLEPSSTFSLLPVEPCAPLEEVASSFFVGISGRPPAVVGSLADGVFAGFAKKLQKGYLEGQKQRWTLS
jgi:hypothetical protein